MMVPVSVSELVLGVLTAALVVVVIDSPELLVVAGTEDVRGGEEEDPVVLVAVVTATLVVSVVVVTTSERVEVVGVTIVDVTSLVFCAPAPMLSAVKRAARSAPRIVYSFVLVVSGDEEVRGKGERSCMFLRELANLEATRGLNGTTEC